MTIIKILVKTKQLLKHLKEWKVLCNLKGSNTVSIEMMEYLLKAQDIVSREKQKKVDIKNIGKLIRTRKPTHGTCCTCQICGGSNDDTCDCPRNDVIKEAQQKIIDTLIS